MATAEEYGQWLQDNKNLQHSKDKKDVDRYNAVLKGYNAAMTEEFGVEGPVLSKPSFADKMQNRAERFAQGASTLVTGPFQLGANIGDLIAEGLGYDPIVGKYVNKRLADLERTKKERMEKVGMGGDADVAGLLGAVGASFALPTKGMTTIGSLLSPRSTTPGGKTIDAMKAGAVFGAAAPVTEEGDYWKDKATQELLGVVSGGLAQPVVSGVSTAAKFGGTALNDLIKTIMAGHGNKKAINELVTKAVLERVNPKDRAEVVQALLKKKTYVPGSEPTVGQAVAAENLARIKQGQPQRFGGSLVRLESDLSGVPDTSDVLRSVEEKSRLARKSFLAPIAGGVDEAAQRTSLGKDIAARTSITEPMYAAAKAGTQPVNIIPLAQKINSLMARNPGNTELQNTLGTIRASLYDQTGKIRTNPEEISSIVDGLKSALAKKENKYIVGVLTDLKDDVSKAIPGYEAAQQKFAEMSAPINQKRVGQALMNKLESVSTGKETPSSFRNVLGTGEQALLKKSTGFPRYERVEQVLTPEQVRHVNAVEKDLIRMQKAKDMASEIRSGGTSLTPEELKSPNLLNRYMAIGNWVLSVMKKDANVPVSVELANRMKNPVEFAKMLQNPTTVSKLQPFLDTVPEVLVRGTAIGAIIAKPQGANYETIGDAINQNYIEQ